MSDYEGEYLTESQRQTEGSQGLVSANLGGVVGVGSLAEILLHHPVFGNNNKVNTPSQPVSYSTDY